MVESYTSHTPEKILRFFRVSLLSAYPRLLLREIQFPGHFGKAKKKPVTVEMKIKKDIEQRIMKRMVPKTDKKKGLLRKNRGSDQRIIWE